MHLVEAVKDLLVTIQADFNPHRTAMAGLAFTLGKRLMADAAQEDTTVTTVRMVAGETIDLPQVHIKMLALQCLGRTVATETERAAGLFQ